MKKILWLFSLTTILIPNNLDAQSDSYDWSIKFGWAVSSIHNFGKTKEWIDQGNGKELLLIGIGYQNIHLNLSYKYFNDLKSEKSMLFGSYHFPNTAVYRNVFMNLTTSYEYEIIKRLFIEPQIGWVRSHITSNVVNDQGVLIEIETADGLIIGSNLIKYFKIYNEFYLGVFTNINYNLISYNGVSNDLGGNTLGCGFGFFLKGTN